MSDLPPLPSYINGQWALPATSTGIFEAINPATEDVCARVALCGADDVDRAMAAARAAFDGYAALSLDARLALVEKLIAVFEARYDEMVSAISTEMGAPHDLSFNAQAECGPGHLKETVRAAREMEWERPMGERGRLVHEPVGVCALITPWNWPINQLAAKVGPALVAGCTMVLKPSEVAPLSAQLFAELIHEAGFPAGVFNMVHGTGPGIGDALTSHPEADMVSFTGSTRAGIQVAKSAAESVKRVSQELGGKSANIVFADAGLEGAIKRGVRHCFGNSGQSCNAPTRMLVEASVYDEAVAIAKKAAEGVKLGDPKERGGHIGPVVSKVHYDKIQRLIEAGIAEGAQCVTGGPGRADGFDRGYYVKPTVFAGVNNEMTIAREEIFGPVLSILTFRTLEEAVEKANNTAYGLSAGVWTDKGSRILKMSTELKAGVVWANTYNKFDPASPFGGYKESGFGREGGRQGLLDYATLV